MVLLILPSKGFFFIRSTVVLVACFITLLAKIISSTSCLENTVKNLSASPVDMDRANFFDWFSFQNSSGPGT